jgi:hypothetical protein
LGRERVIWEWRDPEERRNAERGGAPGRQRPEWDVQAEEGYWSDAGFPSGKLRSP